MRKNTKLYEKLLFSFVMLYCFLALNGFAQRTTADSSVYSPEHFEHYNLASGLSNNRIFSMVQDHHGFVWIGTNFGLNRYDGREFTNYFHNKPPIYLTGSQILRLMNFGGKFIGINPSRGFKILNTETFKTTSLKVPDTTYFSNFRGEIMDVAQLSPNLFLMAAATGVYAFNEKGKLLFRHDRYMPGDENKSRILYGRKVIPLNKNEALVLISYDSHNQHGLAYYNHEQKIYRHIAKSEKKWKEFYPRPGSPGAHYLPLGSGRFLILHYRGPLVYHDTKKRTSIETPVSFTDSLETGWTSKLFKINDSTFALTGHKNGFYIINLNTADKKLSLNPKKHFSGKLCTYMLIDKDKRLWIGTTEGLFKQILNKPFIKTYRLWDSGDPSSRGYLSTITRYKNKLYAGLMTNRDGLMVLDTATLKIEKRIPIFKSKKGANVNSIHHYYGDTLWIGTDAGLLWLDLVSERSGYVLDSSGKPIIGLNDAMSYAPDKDGNIWMTNTFGGEVARYNLLTRQSQFINRHPHPPLPFWRIRRLMFDAFGDVWISGHGLARWSTKLNKIDTSFLVYAGPNKTESNIQTSITVPQGSIWLYNHNNVLLEYDIKRKSFTEHNSENMPIDIESMATYVGNNRLWLIAAGPKLVSYDLKKKIVTYFDQKDGLPEISPSIDTESIYYDSGTDFFYSLHKNIVSRFPSKFPDSKLTTNPLHITELSLKDTVFNSPSQHISLQHSQNSFTLSFTILDFEPSHIYWFFYKLNHGSWQNLNHEKTVNFNNQTYGDNLITIKAINKAGQVYMRTLNIRITPPWWDTYWFKGFLLLMLFAGTFGLFRYRVQQQVQQRGAEIKAAIMAQEAEKQHFSRELHDGVGANLSLLQMYLSSFGETKVPIEELKNRSEKLLAGSIEEIRRLIHDMHPRNLKVLGLNKAVNEMIELVNIGNTMQVNMIATNVPDHLSETIEINLYRIIQELLHNAIKHSEAKHVWLNMECNKHLLVLTYNDDGKSFDTSKVNQGNGLLNIRNRVSLLKGNITLNSAANQGTKVIIEVSI